MKRIISFLLIGLFLASTFGAGVCVAKANYDYKVVGDDGVSYEITGKFGNYNPSQDHTKNRVTVYNADIYDYEGNYVGRADIVNWNSKSNNGAHIKWHVEETEPVANETTDVEPVVDDNTTSEEVANVTEEVANVTEEVNISNESVTEVTNETVTTDNNIGSGSIELDENGTIVNGTAVIPDDGHMCDNITLKGNNTTSKVGHNDTVANKTDNSTNATVADDDEGNERYLDLSNFRTGSTIDLLVIALIICIGGGIYTYRRNH